MSRRQRQPEPLNLDILPTIYEQVLAQAEENIAARRTLEGEVERLWIERLNDTWDLGDDYARELLGKMPEIVKLNDLLNGSDGGF